MDPQFPITIVGGGPAGAAAAIALARMGLPCRVLEAEPAEKLKAGETLPASVRPILAQLGMPDLLEAGGHLPCYGNVAFWGGPEPATHEFLADVHGHGWHLDRVGFERQLREAAMAAGVDWRVGVRVAGLLAAEDGWELEVAHWDGARGLLPAAFVVDATGRSARIARWCGARRISLDGLTGYFAMVEGVARAGITQHTFVEAVADGWWYAAAVPGGRLAISFLSDADLHAGALHEDFLTRKFVETVHLKGMLQGQLPKDALQAYAVRPASTGCLDRISGFGWLAIGDAAFSYDPLSSYGIASALGGGLYAALAIRDLAAGDDAALEAYAKVQGHAFQTCVDMMASHYGQAVRWADAPFWARRLGLRVG